MEHTVVARIRNDAAALTRVVSLLRRRGFDLRSLSVGPCETEDSRRATLVVSAPDVRQVLAQLSRLVDVLDAEALTMANGVEREIVLLTVQTTAATRPDVVALCSVFGGTVVDITTGGMVIEVTGAPARLDRFVELVRPFGLAAVARTGPVALARGPLQLPLDEGEAAAAAAATRSTAHAISA